MPLVITQNWSVWSCIVFMLNDSMFPGSKFLICKWYYRRTSFMTVYMKASPRYIKNISHPFLWSSWFYLAFLWLGSLRLYPFRNAILTLFFIIIQACFTKDWTKFSLVLSLFIFLRLFLCNFNDIKHQFSRGWISFASRQIDSGVNSKHFFCVFFPHEIFKKWFQILNNRC